MPRTRLCYIDVNFTAGSLWLRCAPPKRMISELLSDAFIEVGAQVPLGATGAFCKAARACNVAGLTFAPGPKQVAQNLESGVSYKTITRTLYLYIYLR